MRRFKSVFQTLTTVTVVAIGIQWFSSLIESSFFSDFLERDLITLLIALLAINVTTISVIISKMQELAGQGRLDQTRVIDEMQFSIVEQIALLVLASLLLVIKKSFWLASNATDLASKIEISLIATLVYAIWILFNTGSSIFVIARIENKRLLEQHDNKPQDN